MIGGQRGRLEIPWKLFHEKQLTIGQPVLLSLSHVVIYGRAWPRKGTQDDSKMESLESDVNSLFGIPDTPVVSRCLGASDMIDQHEGYCLIPISLSSLPIATKVSVTVRNVSTLSTLGVPFNDPKTSLWAKKRVVRNALEGLVFRCQCTISHPDRGLKIMIQNVIVGKDADPYAMDSILGPDTLLEILSDTQLDKEEDTTGLEADVASLSLTQSSSRYPGLEEAHRQIMELVMYPVLYPDLLKHLNFDSPKGVLLHGPPGVGKTRLVAKLAEETLSHLVSVSCSDIHSDVLGESEKRLRMKFEEARGKSKTGRPVILFIDELDALTPHRAEASRAQSRLVAQMLTLLDGMESRGRVVVIAATNLPNAIDPALRRPGRFDREIAIDVPSESTRLELLRDLTQDIPLDPSIDLSLLASMTNGFVAADLVAFVRESTLCAALASRSSVNVEDFQAAFKKCGGASSKRGYNLSIENLSWSSIGGLDQVREQLTQLIEWPLLHSATFQRLGLRAPKGILMYGPPGCSKTTIAKIVASTSRTSFFSLNGAQIYSAYVGESERILRSLFTRARMSAPSIIFLDEVDAIVGSRGIGEGGQQDPVRDRILSTLLNEMDGIEMAKGILVMAATNRPDMIDSALLRPGRFDRALYVGAPNAEARLEILQILTKGMPLDESVDLSLLARMLTEGFTGADLKSLCREAAFEAAKRSKESISGFVTMDDIMKSLRSVCASVTPEMQQLYESMATKFGNR